MEYCLIDKLLSSETIVPGIIKNTFANAWRTNLVFNVESLGRNLFLIKFDAKRDNSLLALEDPKVNIRLSHLTFDKVAFWIRLLDISLGFQNKLMAKRIEDAIGSFLEVDSDQDNFCWGESLRIKILIDITKPLRRGVWIKPREDQERMWINIRYERLPNFCYSCG